MGLSIQSCSQSNGNNEEKLILLFEAELQATGEVKPYVVSDYMYNQGFSMRRDLIAQGEGTFKGERLQGTLSWSKLARKYPDHNYSDAMTVGWMETNDGAHRQDLAAGREDGSAADRHRYIDRRRFRRPLSPAGPPRCSFSWPPGAREPQ